MRSCRWSFSPAWDFLTFCGCFSFGVLVFFVNEFSVVRRVGFVRFNAWLVRVGFGDVGVSAWEAYPPEWLSNPIFEDDNFF